MRQICNNKTLQRCVQNIYGFLGFYIKYNICMYVKIYKYMQTLTGKEIEIDIEPTDKVDRIKERVEEKEGIPPQQQRLIFSGKQM